MGFNFCASRGIKVNHKLQTHKNILSSIGLFYLSIAAVNCIPHEYIHEVAICKKLTLRKYPTIQYPRFPPGPFNASIMNVNLQNVYVYILVTILAIKTLQQQMLEHMADGKFPKIYSKFDSTLHTQL